MAERVALSEDNRSVQNLPTALLLLALGASCSPRQPLAGDRPEHGLWALNSPEPELLGSLREGRQLLLAPLVSRSEEVVRAERTRRGLGLRLEGSARWQIVDLALRAIQHPVGHQLLVGSEGALVVGPGQLPRETLPSVSHLPWLARQDGQHLSTAAVTLVPPDWGILPHSLVLIAGDGAGTPHAVMVDGVPHTLGGGRREALVLPAHAKQNVHVEPGGARLDQAFFARVEEVQGTAGVPLLLRDWERNDGKKTQEGTQPDPWTAPLVAHETLDLWFDPPHRAQPGRTWTVLVEIECAEIETRGTPRTESAPSTGWFCDVTSHLGLENLHLEGPAEQLTIAPTMGPGLAWGDVDGDGWVDLYLVQGSGRPETGPLPNRLLRNVGGDHFEDITLGSGAEATGAGMGALFFDADGDGDLDLYVANRGPDVLLEGDGSGHFSPVPLPASLASDQWSAGLAAADHDKDGDLDLYVTRYLDFDLTKMERGPDMQSYQREDPLPMLPFAFPAGENVFLRNEGDLVFEDATEELGLTDANGRGMQPIFWDFDRDADPDLYVANDVSFNVLYRNEGDGTFQDISYRTGVDDPRGGMGLAIGDVDGDLDEDLFLTNWQLEANALYLSNLYSPYEAKHRRASFHDGTVAAGLVGSIGYTSWGAVLFDLECDGDLDLFVANGYTSPDYESTGICVGQPNHLLTNDGSGRFTDVSASAGSALLRALPSRAAAACDFDRDGDLDLAVTANNSVLQLLRNDAPRTGRWLGLRLLTGDTGSPAIGAEVTLRSGNQAWRRSLGAGTSYLAGNPPELHFGLGTVPDRIQAEIRWPSGATSNLELEVDGWRTVREAN